MSQILEIAAREISIAEIPGPGNNNRILRYSQDSGFSWVKRDATQWCSLFLNWVAFQAGLERSNSGLARSWLNVGTPVFESNITPGDIAVFWRDSPTSPKGHVGIFIGYANTNGTQLFILGGNQDDSVSIKAYDKSKVLGFRRLGPDGIIELPNRPLKKGDYGPGVAKLQQALVKGGYYFGQVDGLFQELTEQGIRNAQSTSYYLHDTGEFDLPTRNFLMTKMEELA